MKKYFILWGCIFFCINPLISQEPQKKLTISGTVLDVDGTPIEQAVILIDGEETPVKSDEDGNYTIKVKKDASRIGVIVMGTGMLEEEIHGRSQIDLAFTRELVEMPEFKEEVVEPGDELVNTGYGLIKRKYVAGSVGFLDVEHSKKKYTTIREILLETPGLILLDGYFYLVGGIQNFSGRIPPLFVTDGMPGINLSVQEVANVTVLKGSNGSIYGSRAMGGVVIFTRKRY